MATSTESSCPRAVSLGLLPLTSRVSIKLCNTQTLLLCPQTLLLCQVWHLLLCQVWHLGSPLDATSGNTTGRHIWEQHWTLHLDHLHHLMLHVHDIDLGTSLDVTSGNNTEPYIWITFGNLT